MIDTPQVIQTEAVHYAAIRKVVPVAEIGRIMGPTVHQVATALTDQQRLPAGPWFTHHFRRPMDFFDVEICFPVTEPIAAAGEVHPGIWPAMKVARTVFHGNYSGLPAAWGELEKWMHAEGHAGGGEFWEVYTVNPNTDPTPENWRTELNWPIV